MTTISATNYAPLTQPAPPTTRRIDIAQRPSFADDPGKAMMQSAVVQREMGEKGISNDYVNFVNAMSTQAVRSQMAMQTIETYAASAKAANESFAYSEDSDSSFTISISRSSEASPAPAEKPNSDQPPLVATPYTITTSERMVSAYNAAGSSAPTTQRFDAYA